MKENQFWIAFNVIWAVVIAVFIIAIFIYFQRENELITEMVKAGVDPIEVKCALDDDLGKHPVCVVLAAKRLKCAEASKCDISK